MGPGKILILLFVLFLLFGARRIPALVASIGKGARQLKGSLDKVGRPTDDPDPELEPPAPRSAAAAPPPAARAEPRRLADPRDDDDQSREPRRLL